jgi:hypothetical protein
MKEQVIKIIQGDKSPEEAARILDAAINASFDALSRCIVPAFDDAVFQNHLRKAGCFPKEYRQSDHHAYLNLLCEEEHKRRIAADKKIVIAKLGKLLEVELDGHALAWIERRNDRGQWSGSLYMDGREVSKALVDALAARELTDPTQIATRDAVIALYKEGQSRLEKLDPSIKARAARVYLNVSYAQKDEAKALGAKWDADKRQWYAPTAEAAQKLQQFAI